MRKAKDGGSNDDENKLRGNEKVRKAKGRKNNGNEKQREGK